MNLKQLKHISILLMLLNSSSCKKREAAPESKKAPIAVSVVKIEKNDIREYLTFNGVTQYQKSENIRSNVTGYVSYMPYKIGDRINIGQGFASLRTKEQDALKEAVKIDSSLAKFIGPIRISSNATGIITVLNVTKNAYVAEGDVLATIVQPTSLVVQVNVPYEHAADVKIGTLCEINLQNGEMLTAKITGILPTIDPAAQSKVFIISLPDASLPENLNVQVRTIYKEAKMIMTIPQKALQTNELITRFWVMKVVKDSLAIKQFVTPKLKNDSLVQITSEGMKFGDTVIIDGAYQMQDSTIVSIKHK